MYTILVNDDNSLIASVKERIMQRSKLVDSMHILVNPMYKGYDMSEFTVRLDYQLPISKDTRSEILEYVKDENGNPVLYKDQLEYRIPFDTGLTKENGEVLIELTFTHTDMDEEGHTYQRVRKTSSTTVTITPIDNWCIPSDSALDAIDQRQLKAEEQIKALSEVGELMAASKADNIKMAERIKTDDEGKEITKKVIHLTSNGEKLGDEIEISKIVESGNEELSFSKDNNDGVFPVVVF